MYIEKLVGPVEYVLKDNGRIVDGFTENEIRSKFCNRVVNILNTSEKVFVFEEKCEMCPGKCSMHISLYKPTDIV